MPFIILSMGLLQWVANHFQNLQYLLIGIGFITVWFMMRERNSSTQFKSREADQVKPGRNPNLQSDLANAKLNRKTEPVKAPPLELPGIRLDGESHEILGIAKDSSEAEIMKAYKEGMKRFHPDKIQGQAREQIQFYEEASQKLNQAKDEMIKKIRASKN